MALSLQPRVSDQIKVQRRPAELPRDSTTAVDRWLRANLVNRGSMQSDPCQVTTELYPEDVMVTVRKHHTGGGGVPETGERSPTHTLFIQITIFEDPDIEPRLRESPVGILERWDGLARVPPNSWRFFMDDWEMESFRQPRCIASELFAMLATSEDNIKECRVTRVECYAGHQPSRWFIRLMRLFESVFALLTTTNDC
ncbi:hypothetical protein DENSPDRAFT_853346 [Dentipellis sp. KUC8613]|nr:hypothetical protein DENSPDRAFT_853346 [Dentipellis sp. KUC8613]